MKFQSNWIKRILAKILCLVMVVGLMNGLHVNVVRASTAQSYTKENSVTSTTLKSWLSKSVTGTYKDGQTKVETNATAKYSDKYFKNISTKVQGGLAKLSILAASSAYNGKYAKTLMADCGFKGIKYVYKKPTKKKNDTVSYCIGYRKINGINIVAVWIKGTSGDYEWVSNWNLGKGKTHAGFSTAEKTIYNKIVSYCKKNKISLTKKNKTKFWITGHSRGAAVANLFGKRMTDKLGSANVYAYTYATPRVSQVAKSKGYKNIINYLNPGDFITEVAPAKWGYKRYGQDITLSASCKETMMENFKEITGETYSGFGVKGKKSLLNAFLKYAGNKKSDYTKVRNSLYTSNNPEIMVTPEYFCKYGLGYALGGNVSEGFANVSAVCQNCPRAKAVFSKMVVESKEFGYAHTQAGYLTWIYEMYR